MAALRRENERLRAQLAQAELLATHPNQLWSWDITKLRGLVAWRYYHLYVILDVFSRFIVCWRVEARESARLAEELIADSCYKQNIVRDGLTLHADRGTSMTSKTVAQLLLDLGVTKTHSRPHTSNDNPYSEAQFKTLKYRPGYPDRFGSLQDARRWVRDFFRGLTVQPRAPAQRAGAAHPGGDAHRTGGENHRSTARNVANRIPAAPERFVNGRPRPLPLPQAVWINKPENNA